MPARGTYALPGDDERKDNIMTADEQAIRDMVGRLVQAWNRSDSHGFAAEFARHASFIHIYGGQIDGRTAIEIAHRTIFDTIYKDSKNDYLIHEIRFIRPEVALVLLRAHLKFHEAGEPREIHARPTMVVVKEDGQWQAVLFQNTRIAEAPPLPKIPDVK